MTVAEAVIYELGYNAVGLVEKLLIDQGVQPEASYVPQSHSYIVKLVTAKALRRLAAMPEYREGSYAVKVDRVACNRRADEIFRELGMYDQIRNYVKVKTL